MTLRAVSGARATTVRRRRRGRGVIILTVSGGYQSCLNIMILTVSVFDCLNMWLFPFHSPLNGGDFDHGTLMWPGLGSRRWRSDDLAR